MADGFEQSMPTYRTIYESGKTLLSRHNSLRRAYGSITQGEEFAANTTLPCFASPAIILSLNTLTLPTSGVCPYIRLPTHRTDR